MTEVVTGAPLGGSYNVVTARARRACALSTVGALSCWGSGAPALNGENATTGYAALALGKAGVCGLRTNSTIRCFDNGVAAPPGNLADLQYIDVQAQGRAFCSVLMANYSLVCWGSGEFTATNRLVFDRVLSGPCMLMSSCRPTSASAVTTSAWTACSSSRNAAADACVRPSGGASPGGS